MSEAQFEDHGDGLLARLIWSNDMPLPDHLADRNIQAVIAQRPDGTVVTDDPSLSPRVYLYDSALTVTDARVLAKALTDAANLADQWCGSLDLTEMTDRELLEILPDLDFKDNDMRATVQSLIHLGEATRNLAQIHIIARAMELGR
ncbi:hypothetical protein BKG77_08015 [Mycobacteroides chelonae]|uniref:Uncharacterized protein n=1 Tax=Mycobacteroides chelonae TaxID=1774 RepID=A0A1S1M373_MYCCH|nr:hypothetical protein [Mycobacteroides chelonae]OHU23578.1 hypothetical protein BKG77_08015 [Mycobacteroides chelonae]OHU77660.1 hypothetical protein BKG84_03855 [Mycobacteroides chelonae]